ncbi:MAG TPA: thioredoxin domain-containing protein [Streptosporangiaceae bacterium]
MNRLKDATSPYLLQHAGNPVDWWPWSGEAFEQARERDVPVLLSVGYSACHWCHVMAHESFEDQATAALMNTHLVSIKVDREERPDVDAVYMAATQAMTGQGGWPMTVFMTAEGEPFYCGTYFPRDYFQRLIRGVVRVWRDDRDSVTGQAKKVSLALAERATATSRALHDAGEAQETSLGLGELADGGWNPSGPGGRRLAAACDGAVRALGVGFDERNGGFGSAPKFPPSMVLEFLLRQHTRADADGWALRMAGQTMEAMARGGMYDQLAGGFARYSVDAAWVVPHFEKMLYDNALLARAYAHLWRQTSSPLARRVAGQTCDWMVGELRTQEGGLAAALDADSEGEEGKFYTWTREELTVVLGLGDGQFAADVFGVTTSGTFERGLSVLQLRADPAEEARFARVRAALLAARAERVRPGRDDKVVAAWNGMAIAALAETGLLLRRRDLIEVATGAAELLARVHIDAAGGPGARIVRTSRDGVAGPGAGLLEDYACVAGGFLVLSGVTGEARWVDLAGRLLETALTRFADGQGGFFDTADDGEQLLYRPADPMDNATPSGSFAVAGALLSYAALTGSARHRDAAIAVLEPLGALAEQYPRAAGTGLAVAEALLAGPAEIAVVGPPGDPGTAALHAAALGGTSPGAVVALGDGTGESTVPLLAGRGLVDGAPAVYVCRNFTCRAPITGIAELASALSGTE